MLGSTSPELAEWYSTVFLPFVDGLNSQAAKDTMKLMAAVSMVAPMQQQEMKEIAARSSSGGGRNRHARGISEMDEEAIKQVCTLLNSRIGVNKSFLKFLGHYRRMESDSHREALKEAEDMAKRGEEVKVYTGGKGMKVIMNAGGKDREDDDGEEVNVEVVEGEEEGEDVLVDEMGDEYI